MIQESRINAVIDQVAGVLEFSRGTVGSAHVCVFEQGFAHLDGMELLGCWCVDTTEAESLLAWDDQILNICNTVNSCATEIARKYPAIVPSL